MNKLLASTWMLFLKTQTAHWRVSGKEFFSLHKMLQLQYEDLFNAIDSIGETISMKGGIPISTMSEILKESHVVDALVEKMTSEEIILFLLEANKVVVALIESEPELKSNFGERLSAHTKWQWFFESSKES